MDYEKSIQIFVFRGKSGMTLAEFATAFTLFVGVFYFITGAQSLPDLFKPRNLQPTRSRGRPRSSSPKDRSFGSILHNAQYWIVAVMTLFSVLWLGPPALFLVVPFAVLLWKPANARSKPKLNGFWMIVAVAAPSWLAWLAWQP